MNMTGGLARPWTVSRRPLPSLVTFTQHIGLILLSLEGGFSEDNEHNMKQLPPAVLRRDSGRQGTHVPGFSEEGRSPRSFISFTQLGDISPQIILFSPSSATNWQNLQHWFS